MKHSLKEIPVFMIRKLINNYDVCVDFRKLTKRENIKEIGESRCNVIKDLEVTPFLVDSSNFNTMIVQIKNKAGKSVVVCGDFRNYDGYYAQDKFKTAISVIQKADLLFVEGKYLGKYGNEYASGSEMLEKTKNIMKFYKQVFVIQSETDFIMAENLYEGAKKTKKIFIENTFLCNLATLANGSLPTPFSNRKVYSYTPFQLENADFDFKRKYVAPFTVNSAINKMKRAKYVMIITKDMMQDIQIFEKDGSIFDACIILSEWKGFAEKDPQLAEFIKFLKDRGMDYYELYTHGEVNLMTIKELINRFNPRSVIPIEFSYENVDNMIPNFRILKTDEELEV